MLFTLWVLCSTTTFSQADQIRRADKQFDFHAYASALEVYRDYNRRNPGSAWVEGRIGACLVRLNRPADALPFLEKAKTRKNAPPDLFQFLGLAYRSMGRYGEAKSHFQGMRSDSTWAIRAVEGCNWALAYRPSTEHDCSVREMVQWNSPASELGIAPLVEGWVFSSFRTSIPSPPPGWVSGQAIHYLFRVEDNANFRGSPTLLKRELGYVPNEGPCAVDPHSGRVVFMRSVFHGNQQLTPEAGFTSGLFVANIDPKGNWEQVKPFDHNGAGFSNAWPSFSDDGERLYFSSDRAGGMGGFDLYVSHWDGKGWGQPIHLGRRINSSGNEITPREWNGHLFFASDGHPGFGGYDLFIGYRFNDGYLGAQNLGKPRNSSYDDMGLCVSGPGEGYFISNRKGSGDLDIYRFSEGKDALRFIVADAITGTPLQGVMASLGTESEITLVSDRLGIMTITDKKAGSEKILLRREGYVPQHVDLRLTGMKEGLHQFTLWPKVWVSQPQVIDAVSGLPLPSAKWQLTESRTGFSTGSSVDSMGAFLCRLKPRTSYFLVVTSDGFERFEKEFTTGAQPSDPLGSIAMRVVDKRGRSISDKSAEQGFVIQLGAVRGGKKPDLAAFGKAEAHGTLFVEVDSMVSRVKLGYFASRAEADSISRILGDLGFKDRMIIRPVSITPDTSKTQMAPPNNTFPYRLRLVALRHSGSFDASPWKAHGEVVSERSGDFTVFYLVGVSDLATARNLRAKAVAAGFVDARIQEAVPQGFRYVD